MAGKIKVDQIETVAGTGTITLNNDVAMAATKTLPAASLTGTLPANIVDSDSYVDGSIDTAHYAAGSVDATAIGNDVVNSQHYAAASIDNEHLADDAVGVAELSATGTASSSTFLRGDNSWQTAGKRTEMFVLADDVVGNISSGGYFFTMTFTPTMTGQVFLSHVGNQRFTGSGGNHLYVKYRFNNGSGSVIQNTMGVGYAISAPSHNQGWSWSAIPTASTGDSSTPITVTAGTQCTFSCQHDGASTANEGNDDGKDHIASALVIET